MTTDTDYQTLAVDLTALQAVVRGLCRAYAGRSPAALSEVLDGLTMEAERLEQAAALTGCRTQTGAWASVEAWIDDFRDEVLASSHAQKRASL